MIMMRPLTRTVPLVLALWALAACDRAPESPPAPRVEVPAPPAVDPLPAGPAAVPVPPVMPAATSAEPPAPRPGAAAVALPQGFVRIAGGAVTAADGRPQAVAGYAIAREPVTAGELRAWAESGAGRRLPGLAEAGADAVATDLDWAAADAYARWRSERERRHYRLPTELEWRRAAQSGRIHTQAQRQPAEPPLWEWTADCWRDEADDGACASRVLVGGDNAAAGDWGRAPMGARRPAASFRLVLDLVP